MQRSGSKLAKGFEVIRCGVTLILTEAILRVKLIEFEHAAVAINFGEDRCGGNGNGPRIAVNDRLLFDGKVELYGVEQQVIGKGTQLGNGGDHRLTAGLINVPGIDAAGVDFSDGPGESVFADPFGEPDAAFWREFFRVVKAHNAAFGVQDDGCREDGTEERAATCFVQTRDALPAVLTRDALVARAAEPCHRAGL